MTEGDGSYVAPSLTSEQRAPVRIQRKRVKGWRMPEGAVYVGRPTVWGNRWRDYLRRELAVQLYRDDALAGRIGPIHDIKDVASIVRELRGKDLACWCPLDQPCHADVLLDLANHEAVNAVTENRMNQESLTGGESKT